MPTEITFENAVEVITEEVDGLIVQALANVEKSEQPLAVYLIRKSVWEHLLKQMGLTADDLREIADEKEEEEGEEDEDEADQ